MVSTEVNKDVEGTIIQVIRAIDELDEMLVKRDAAQRLSDDKRMNFNTQAALPWATVFEVTRQKTSRGFADPVG